METYMKRKGRKETEKVIRNEAWHCHNFQDPCGSLTMFARHEVEHTCITSLGQWVDKA